ncbi:hypothetical protein ACOME3_002594 [Neoechinorhynchus agilis]
MPIIKSYSIFWDSLLDSTEILVMLFSVYHANDNIVEISHRTFQLLIVYYSIDYSLEGTHSVCYIELIRSVVCLECSIRSILFLQRNLVVAGLQVDFTKHFVCCHFFHDFVDSWERICIQFSVPIDLLAVLYNHSRFTLLGNHENLCPPR